MAEIRMRLNGADTVVAAEPNETLLDVLRDRIGLTGAKRGCDTGDCGACTVLMDGETVNACLVLAPEADGCDITTIEGVNHPIQERFAQAGAFQCGYCAPGVVMSACRLLGERETVGAEEAADGLSGHLCRCTGYVRLLEELRGETEAFAPHPDYDVIGSPVVRRDIRDKIAGRARFTADHVFPGMLYGALVTSPIPHGRVKSIDADAARALDGVVLVLLPEDVPDGTYGVSPARLDETILAKGVVRQAGEAVAAVFAHDRITAERAAAAVRVEYDPLPAVFDPEEALAPHAPQIHERYKGNVNTEIHQEFGDLEKAFAEADLVRDDVFEGHRTHHGFLEPQASLAVPEGDVMNLWTANQTPHHVRWNLARVLEIPESSLRVVKPAMGGGFGGKAEATKLDFLSVIAAQRTGRPVLMTLDREQVFQQGRGRHRQKIRLRTAFAKDGRLLAMHEEATLDGGAYTSYGIITAYYSGSLTPTPYRLPAFRYDARRVVTNLPACGAQRGNGTPYPRFAFESQLDMAAKDLGLDPLAIRSVNLIEEGDVTVNGLQITSCGIRQCLEEAARISHFRERHGRLPFGHGIGLGLGCFISGAGGSIVRGDLPHSAATLRVDEDGRRVWLFTGAPEIGQGSDTILCQIAAEELGIPYEQVSIVSSDSAVAPKDLGAYASRITFMAGNAVRSAAADLRARLAAFWSERHGTHEAPVFRRGMVTGENHETPFHELAADCIHAHGPLAGHGSYSPPSAKPGQHKGASVGTSPAYSFCAVVAEARVHPETGQVRVPRFWCAHDSGTVINPVTFHGQVEGALVMGMGETLFERVEHRNGVLRNADLHDYLLPTTADAPEIHCVSVPVYDPAGPFGAKEVGEGTILPVFAAIANAVDDAVGVRIQELPITAEKVWRALKEKP